MESISVPIFDIFLVLRREPQSDPRHPGDVREPIEIEWHSSWLRPSAVSRQLNEFPPDVDVIVLGRDKDSGGYMGHCDREKWINNNLEAVFREFLKDGAKLRYLIAKQQRFLAEQPRIDDLTL